MSDNKRWFHGTPCTFDEFDAAYIGKGNDQLGSGFYFTNEESTARGYAGTEADACLIVAELAIEKPLPVDAVFSRNQIEALLRACPDFEMGMTNWGEIGFEKEATVVGRAVSTYATLNEGCNDAVEVLNAISNDLWGGMEADFLRAVRDITGYDGLYRQSGTETHAVVWFPQQVRVIERIPVATAALSL